MFQLYQRILVLFSGVSCIQESLILYDVLVGDALLVKDTADCLCKHVSDRQLLDFRTALCVRDGVCEYYFLQCTVLHAFACRVLT